MSISSPRDFHYFDEKEVSADVVIDDPRVTLYCLDARRQEAVFVEAKTSVALHDDPFFYQAQYRHAQGAVVMPLSAWHAAATAKGDRFERAVMIHSVGRCGSTLLSKMFGQLPQCLSLSEPDVYTQLLTDGCESTAFEPLLRSATRHYYQPPAGARPTHLVLKFRSFCIELAAAMQRATPTSIPIFLYRDVQRVVASGMRVFRYAGAPLWRLDRLHAWRIARPLLAGVLWSNRGVGERLFPAMKRFTSWELSRMGAAGLLAIAWVSAMERWAELKRDGMDILAIRYDDLTGPSREATIAGLLDHCHLPASAMDLMIQAQGDDSQAESPVARARQQPYELTARDREIIRQVLSRSDAVDGEP